MTNLHTAYATLLQETLGFLHALPKETYLLGTAEENAYFPKALAQKIVTPEIIAPKPLPAVAPPPKRAPIPPTPVAAPPHPVAEPSKPTPTPALHTALKKVAPYLRLTDQVPDDQPAQRIASAWQEKMPDIDVLFLLLKNGDDTVEFVKNLGKAVHTQLGSAKVITGTRLEKEKRWDLLLTHNAFRLIIATEGLEQFPDLMRHYTAIPAQDSASLGKTPLITLAPTQTYLNSPIQKALLWKRLCQLLKR